MIKYFCFFIWIAFTQWAIAAVHLPVPDSQDDAVKILQVDETSLVYYDGKGLGLMNLSGQRLSAANYFSIYPLGQKKYATQMHQGGKYALMNGNGKLITPFDYTEISSFSGNTVRVQRKTVTDENSEKTEYAIVSDDGIQVSEWMDSLAAVSGDGEYIFRNQGRWGLFQKEGIKFLSKNFEDIGVFNAGMAPARLDGKWGFIEKNGVWVIAPVFKGAGTFEGRYAPVQLADDKWQLIDRKGQALLPEAYDSVNLYQDGAYGIVHRGGKSSYLGFNAQMLNREWYDKSGKFSEEGIARIRKDTSDYYISINGDEIFHADKLLDFKYGRGVFRKQNKWGWINEDAEVIVEPIYDTIIYSEGDYLIVRQGTQFLLVNAKGEVVQEIHTDIENVILTASALIYGLKPTFYLIDLLKSQTTLLKYDEVGDISAGVMVVRKDSLYGYVDIQGKEIVPPENHSVALGTEKWLMIRKNAGDDFIAYDKNYTLQYQLPNGITFLGPFKEGRAKVINQYGLMGLIDEQGKLVVPCKYSLLGDYRSGRVIFRNLNGLFGYLDAGGQEIIPAIYKFVSDFDSKGYAAVVKDKQFGFIHLSGNIVVPFQYDNVLSLSNGIASVEKEGKVGYINMQNKKIVPFTFDEAFQVVEELALVRMSIYWGYISAKGKVEIPWQFAEAQAFSEGKAWVRFEDKFGAINTRGAYVISFKYEEALPFETGFAKVQNKGKWGLVNEYGVEIIPPVCEQIGQVFQQKVVVKVLSDGYGIKLFNKK